MENPELKPKILIDHLFHHSIWLIKENSHKYYYDSNIL